MNLLLIVSLSVSSPNMKQTLQDFCMTWGTQYILALQCNQLISVPAYLAPSVSWCLAKGLIAVNDWVIHNLSIRQYETWVGWKIFVFIQGSLAPHSFYFMIKLSYMNDLARNWKYRVRGIIHKLEHKYIKPGLLHFWFLTFLWHFYKMTMLWLLSNLNFNGGFYRHRHTASHQHHKPSMSSGYIWHHDIMTWPWPAYLAELLELVRELRCSVVVYNCYNSTYVDYYIV